MVRNQRVRNRGTSTSVANWRPSLGRYIATIRIEHGDLIRSEQTGDPESGHYTLWGDPDALLRRVVDVAPV